jgi:hypothetical protein
MNCFENSSSHILNKFNFSFEPPYGAVIDSNFTFPGTDIIRYTEKRVSHQRTTDGVSFLSSFRSRNGINIGSPQEAKRGRGNRGSISLKEERGCPPINLCRATVSDFRYLTTNTEPWLLCSLSNMDIRLLIICNLEATFDVGNRIRVKTRPYLFTTNSNSFELRSDTI